MRKPLVFAVSAVLALMLAPAAAQAHHLEQDTSTVVCVLDYNKPTVKVSANYVDFSPWDMPIYWAASIDKVTVGGGPLTWVGPDHRHDVSFETTAGSHDVVYQASWNGGDQGGYISKRSLVCPVPIPPPVVVVVTPPPPPPPPCACPPPVVKPKPKPFKCVCRVRIVKPKAHHGRRHFGAKLVTKGRIVESTLTVTAIGQGRRVVGSPRAKLHTRGGVFVIWLYDLTVWKHRLAWGDYRLTFRFVVKVNGHVCIVKRTTHFRNHDPEGGPA